jgi:hypoxia up-regulated 1
MLALAVVLGVSMLAVPTESIGVATISIDLGNEWMKVGLVKPGVPMDIVLNVETKRKTNAFVGLRDNERTYSASAMTVATKFPQFAFGYMFELLGQKVDSPAVDTYKERFPHHTIVAHPTRGTVAFELADTSSEEEGATIQYTVEEMLAQLVEHAVKLAAETAQQEISSCVFVVPPYFTQAQRKALLLVGKIADIKVLQLLNSPTAVAINYGVFRTKEFNETARNILFYDMGASSTVASVVSYQLTTDKKSKSKEQYPQLAIKGTGYDRTLGGVEFTYRLRKHLLGEFLKNPKVKGDVAGHPRAMAKLFDVAEKTKKILSANKETQARVEGLYDEVDFKASVTRELFESLGADLFTRVTTPIDQALEMAKMTIDEIDELIIFGGGLRIPKVQDILAEKMGVEQLGKSINADEAACLGASYRSAALSKAFRLKKFEVKDASLFPVKLTYEKPIFTEAPAAEEGAEPAEFTPEFKEFKETSVTMFSKQNALPQKKVFRFKNMSGDFSFSLSYGNTSFLPESEQAFFQPPNLAVTTLHNVSAASEGHENDDAQGIKVTLSLDKNGIVSVEKTYAEFKREPEPEPEPEKGILDSVADGLSSMLGLGDDDKKDANADAEDQKAGLEADADDKKADADEKEEANANADDTKKADADAGADDKKEADADANVGADADADAEKKDGDKEKMAEDEAAAEAAAKKEKTAAAAEADNLQAAHRVHVGS